MLVVIFVNPPSPSYVLFCTSSLAHWPLDLGAYIMKQVVRVLRANPVLVMALIAMVLACLVHPSFGLLILLCSHFFSCHNALCRYIHLLLLLKFVWGFCALLELGLWLGSCLGLAGSMGFWVVWFFRRFVFHGLFLYNLRCTLWLVGVVYFAIFFRIVLV